MRQGCRESQRSYLGRPVVRLQSNPDREVRLRRQGSAEAIVPSNREGLNIERMSTTSSSRDEHERPPTSLERNYCTSETGEACGNCAESRASPARDGGKSSARSSVPVSVNRRMRTRMSGGLRGSG